MRYNLVAKSLHWLMALMIIGQLAGGVIMLRMDPSQLKFTLFQYHKSFGFLLLVLAILRLGWRLLHWPPALPNDMQPWEKVISNSTHWFFYGFMLLMPMIGWAMISSSDIGVKTQFFGLFTMPHLPVPNAWNEILTSTHKYYAYATIGLLLLHVAAALKHHFINKDNVLRRMLP